MSRPLQTSQMQKKKRLLQRKKWCIFACISFLDSLSSGCIKGLETSSTISCCEPFLGHKQEDGEDEEVEIGEIRLAFLPSITSWGFHQECTKIIHLTGFNSTETAKKSEFDLHMLNSVLLHSWITTNLCED